MGGGGASGRGVPWLISAGVSSVDSGPAGAALHCRTAHCTCSGVVVVLVMMMMTVTDGFVDGVGDGDVFLLLFTTVGDGKSGRLDATNANI